jgi:Rv2258c-like winged HTH domain
VTHQTIAPSPATGTDLTLSERLVASTIGALELFSIHVGRALGLYDLLTQGPTTAPVLAERAGIAPRYAREWLEQQAVAGLITDLRPALCPP